MNCRMNEYATANHALLSGNSDKFYRTEGGSDHQVLRRMSKRPGPRTDGRLWRWSSLLSPKHEGNWIFLRRY
jgi:hypothetical protein